MAQNHESRLAFVSNNKDIVYRTAKTVVDEYFNGDGDVFQTQIYKVVESE